MRPLSRAGKVVVAGPLFADDGKTPRGSLIVLEAASLEEARALAARDPYVVEGVFARHDVHPFTAGLSGAAGLVSEVGDADELPHAVGSQTSWRESYGFELYDAASGLVGVGTRRGAARTRARWTST